MQSITEPDLKLAVYELIFDPVRTFRVSIGMFQTAKGDF